MNPQAFVEANLQPSANGAIAGVQAEVPYHVIDTGCIRYAGDNERKAWATFDHFVRCNHEVEIFYRGMRVRSSNDCEG